MKEFNIPEHWDLTCQITADSDAESEFLIWQQWANSPMGANKEDWRGDEFTLDDFVQYISKLRKDYSPFDRFEIFVFTESLIE